MPDIMHICTNTDFTEWKAHISGGYVLTIKKGLPSGFFFTHDHGTSLISMTSPVYLQSCHTGLGSETKRILTDILNTEIPQMQGKTLWKHMVEVQNGLARDYSLKPIGDVTERLIKS